MSQEIQETRKKINFRRNFINILLVVVIGISSGLFLGSWYSYNMLASSADYSGLDANLLTEDVSVVIGRSLNIKKVNDDQRKNWVSLAKSKGITPKKISGGDNTQLAIDVINNASSWTAIGTGKVETIVTQTVYSAKYYDGTTYAFESISKGIVNVATIAVYGKDNTDVTTIVGNNIKETSASWNGKSEKMTTEAYVDKNGGLPSNAIPYIISSQTVINSSDVTESEVDGKKLYSYTIALHPLKSVVNYIKQVKQTSGLSDYPTFNDITIDVVIDENWNFVKFNIVENYRVVYSGLKPKCKGVLNIDFTVNQPVTLPEYKD